MAVDNATEKINGPTDAKWSMRSIYMLIRGSAGHIYGPNRKLNGPTDTKWAMRPIYMLIRVYAAHIYMGLIETQRSNECTPSR